MSTSRPASPDRRARSRSAPRASEAATARPDAIDPDDDETSEDDSEEDPGFDAEDVEDPSALDLSHDDDGDAESDDASDEDGNGDGEGDGDGDGQRDRSADGGALPVLSTGSLPVPSQDPKAPGLAQASALSAYMAQLRHYAPITREEEHALAVRWVEEGDVEAAKQLVVSNLRLVVKIAMEYRRAWTNTLDLIQEGNVGLMEAVQRFDPYQGVKLSSYAVYWIRAYILKYILDNMRSVRLGTTRASRKLFFRLNKEKRELERQGYEAEPRLLAERLDVSEEDVIDMEARLARPDLSFDAPLRSDEGDGMTYGDRIASPGLSSETLVGADELRSVFLEKIAEFSETLNDRDRQILEERVLSDEPRTLADLGEEFSVSRERVRQLEAKLVGRLRSYMEENLVDFEYYGPDAT